MEEELRCPVCKQLYSSPVLLPCYHALCLACALDIQTASSSSSSAAAAAASAAGGSSSSGSSSSSGAVAVQLHQHQHHPGPSSTSSASSSSSASSTTGSSSATESVSSDQDQADKVSILSEADSGVICCTSRPGSYAGTPNLQGLLFPPSGSGSSVYSLVCPVCRKLVFFDELGARNLPLYRAMESIVDRFCEREALRCQMCETEPPKVATVICEQCEIRYCDACRELCHPARGPLAKHSLTKPRGACQLRESICGEHTEPLTMYCMGCKLPICNQCIGEQNRHQSHDLQSITAMCKAQK
ncbi:tripartite motif protein trim9, partial [Anopheles darlingi]